MIITTMCLRVVLYQFEMMTVADIPYPFRIGTATIEMNNHNGTSARGNRLFDERVIYLERIKVWLNEHRFEKVLRDGENGGDIKFTYCRTVNALILPMIRANSPAVSFA